MEDGLKALAAIATAVIGLAIVAVIVSKNANTAGAISAAASGFSSIITAAVGPVSGGTGANLTNSSGIYLTNPAGMQLGTLPILA